MPVARKDITIPQSDNWRMVITVVGGPNSLAGYTGEMQVRSSKASTVVLAEVPPEAFTVDDVNRQVVIELTGAATEVFDWDSPAVYDVHIASGSDRWRLAEGRAILNKTVTRED